VKITHECEITLKITVKMRSCVIAKYAIHKGFLTIFITLITLNFINIINSK